MKNQIDLNKVSNFMKFEHEDIFTSPGFGRVSTIDFDDEFSAEPVERTSENSPAHYLMAKSPAGYPFQAGATWVNTNKDGDPYLTIHIRDRKYRANLGKYPGQDDPTLFAIIRWEVRD